MTFVAFWLATLVGTCYFVFWSGSIQFHHFWHQWEFFSASSAALYNLLIFAAVFFLRRRDGRTLDYALGSGIKKFLVFMFRFMVPILLLVWVGVLVWLDRNELSISHATTQLKLRITFGAFLSFLIGDSIILTRLRTQEGTLPDSTLKGWRREFKTHIYYVHLPFILSYLVLLTLYAQQAGASAAENLSMQTFLGGASALEVLLQSTIHAFSTVPHSYDE